MGGVHNRRPTKHLSRTNAGEDGMNANLMMWFQARKKSTSRCRCQSVRRLNLERLDDRRLLAADLDWGELDFRTIDGTGNNESEWLQGAAGTPLIRMAGDAEYPDDIGDDMGGNILPNPRLISNQIADQGDELIFNDHRMSDFVWQWGQFLDHDISFTGSSPENGTAYIDVMEEGDPLGPGPIPFVRSDYVTDEAGVRQQVNQITSYIDASNVYGSSDERADALRTFVGGKLKTSEGDLLPLNVAGLPNAGDGNPAAPLFLAGDVRANEQVGLTAMHTLFVREHNRLAERLAKKLPKASDEQLYQLARKIVGAELQIITYNEFVPAVLGKNALPGYRGYDASVNASIANEFSTALFRFGHSMLSPQLLLLDGSRNVVGSLPLKNAFFNRDFLKNDPQNVDRVLRGLAAQTSQMIDNKIVDDVRNFLFGPPGAGGLDLASLNIQRGRDSGLPDYNQLRETYGLPRVTSFDEIGSDPDVWEKLAGLYGSVDNIDPWVGALAEQHMPGASVGPLIYAALVDQFTRLRDGDRFFYLNDSDLNQPSVRSAVNLDSVTLSKIIRWNTGIQNLPADVFTVRGKNHTFQPVTGLDVDAMIASDNHVVAADRRSSAEEVIVVVTTAKTASLVPPAAPTDGGECPVNDAIKPPSAATDDLLVDDLLVGHLRAELPAPLRH